MSLKNAKNTLIYYLIITLKYLLGLFSFNTGKTIGKYIGITAYYLANKERNLAFKNVTIVFPKLNQVEKSKIVKKSFINLGISLLEIININKNINNLNNIVKITDKSKQVLDSALNSQKGIIYVTGHIGNWELMAGFLAKSGYPINTIVRRLYDKRLDHLLNSFRSYLNIKTIYRGSSESVKEMLKVFRRGEILGLLLDQSSKKIPSIKIDFMGKQAFVPTGAARLYEKTKAELIAGFIRRKGDHHIIEIEKIEIENFKSEPNQTELCNIINSYIEKHIKKNPEEWIWFHNRWNIKIK